MAKIAFVFRYPFSDLVELFHGFDRVYQMLSEKYEMVYLSMKPPCEESGSTPASVKYCNISIDRKNRRDVWIKTIIWILMAPCMGLRLRRMRPDYIWIEEHMPFQPWLIQVFSGVPVGCEIGDFWLLALAERSKLLGPFFRIVHWIESSTWKRLNGTIVHSNAAGDVARNCKVAESELKLVRDCLDPEIFRPIHDNDIRNELGYSKSDFVLATHGLLHRNKGFSILLEQFHHAYEQHRHLRLMFIGDGDDSARLQAQVSDLGLQEVVKFTGWLRDHLEVNRYLNAADVLICFRKRSLANDSVVTGTLVHSLATGKPLIVSALPAMSEIIRSGENGFLLDLKRKDGLKSVVDELLQMSGEQREEIGKNGLETVKNTFHLDKTHRDFVSAIESFLQATKTAK